jgi:hypothetical protein
MFLQQNCATTNSAEITEDFPGLGGGGAMEEFDPSRVMRDARNVAQTRGGDSIRRKGG